MPWRLSKIYRKIIIANVQTIELTMKCIFIQVIKRCPETSVNSILISNGGSQHNAYVIGSDFKLLTK